MSHKKFLEFNSRNIYFLSVDGTYWLAVKPICEALGVNYNRQFQNLKEDEILSQLFAEQQMVAGDGKLRKMVSLPEKWVYGWLFSIRSESEELKQYKLKCYELLYDYFHGTMTQRVQTLRVKSEAELALEQAEAKLRQTSEWKEVENARRQIKDSKATLNQIDERLKQNQTTLFNK
ncbi:phage antirepressor N-terminal domain-containing protein [Larkinella sp.]|uniref:phage antirepressor N-terminal domain-containing protein n=1 Tax=Larkinella sp. TaxID=2034517 RepID=UPI003BAC4296